MTHARHGSRSWHCLASTRTDLHTPRRRNDGISLQQSAEAPAHYSSRGPAPRRLNAGRGLSVWRVLCSRWRVGGGRWLVHGALISCRRRAAARPIATSAELPRFIGRAAAVGEVHPGGRITRGAGRGRFWDDGPRASRPLTAVIEDARVRCCFLEWGFRGPCSCLFLPDHLTFIKSLTIMIRRNILRQWPLGSYRAAGSQQGCSAGTRRGVPASIGSPCCLEGWGRRMCLWMTGAGFLMWMRRRNGSRPAGIARPPLRRAGGSAGPPSSRPVRIARPPSRRPVGIARAPSWRYGLCWDS